MEHIGCDRLPGWMARFTLNHWTSKVVETTEEPHGLGRCSTTMLQGKNKIKLMIICADQVCKQSTSVGLTTSHSQQVDFIENERIKYNAPMTRAPSPWDECITDLEKEIQRLHTWGDSIMLSMGTNEMTDKGTMKDRRPKRNSIEGLIHQSNLNEVFQYHHDDKPKSTTTTNGWFSDRECVSVLHLCC